MTFLAKHKYTLVAIFLFLVGGLFFFQIPIDNSIHKNLGKEMVGKYYVVSRLPDRRNDGVDSEFYMLSSLNPSKNGVFVPDRVFVAG